MSSNDIHLFINSDNIDADHDVKPDIKPFVGEIPSDLKGDVKPEIISLDRNVSVKIELEDDNKPAIEKFDNVPSGIFSNSNNDAVEEMDIGPVFVKRDESPLNEASSLDVTPGHSATPDLNQGRISSTPKTKSEPRKNQKKRVRAVKPPPEKPGKLTAKKSTAGIPYLRGTRVKCPKKVITVTPTRRSLRRAVVTISGANSPSRLSTSSDDSTYSMQWGPLSHPVGVASKKVVCKPEIRQPPTKHSQVVSKMTSTKEAGNRRNQSKRRTKFEPLPIKSTKSQQSPLIISSGHSQETRETGNDPEHELDPPDEIIKYLKADARDNVGDKYIVKYPTRIKSIDAVELESRYPQIVIQFMKEQAMKKECSSSDEDPSEDGLEVYVSNLCGISTTKQALRHHFERNYVAVASVQLMRRKCNSFAFIECRSQHSFRKALRLNDTVFNGRALYVDHTEQGQHASSVCSIHQNRAGSSQSQSTRPRFQPPPQRYFSPRFHPPPPAWHLSRQSQPLPPWHFSPRFRPPPPCNFSPHFQPPPPPYQYSLQFQPPNSYGATQHYPHGPFGP